MQGIFYNWNQFWAVEVKELHKVVWALHDRDKLAPLLKLGMNIVETGMADKFRADSDGKIAKFEGCKLIVTKEEWLTKLSE